MNVCNDCDKRLPQNATSCPCGWTLPPKVVAPASREEMLAQGDAEHLAKAREYCRTLGLERGADEPYEEWESRVRKHLRTTVLGRLVA